MISGGKINNGYAIVTPNVTFFRHVHVTFVLESNVIVTKMFHFRLALGVTFEACIRYVDVMYCKRHVSFVTIPNSSRLPVITKSMKT